MSIFKESDNLWWDAFATEFFEDDAMLTLSFSMEDGPKRYSEFHSSILLSRVCRLFGIFVSRCECVTDLFASIGVIEMCFD